MCRMCSGIAIAAAMIAARSALGTTGRYASRQTSTTDSAMFTPMAATANVRTTSRVRVGARSGSRARRTDWSAMVVRRDITRLPSRAIPQSRAPDSAARSWVSMSSSVARAVQPGQTWVS